MTKKALQLGFCILAIAALSAAPAMATPPSLAYTLRGVGATMEQACSNAVQRIQDYCDFFGPISTDQNRCLPLYGVGGQLLGYVCTCDATTPICGHFIDFP